MTNYRKAWFAGVTAVFLIAVSGINAVRADVPNWFIDLVWLVGSQNTAQQAEIDALTSQVAALEAYVNELQTYVAVEE